jgi:hypothetical protein
MPDQRHESHHKICNLRYGTHGYGMSACKIQGVHLLKLIREQSASGQRKKQLTIF